MNLFANIFPFFCFVCLTVCLEIVAESLCKAIKINNRFLVQGNKEHHTRCEAFIFKQKSHSYVVQFAMYSCKATDNFSKGDSYIVQFAAIIRNVVSHSHRRSIHPKGDSDIVQLRTRTRHAA